MIAAIARVNGGRLATRNLDNFATSGLQLIAPWEFLTSRKCVALLLGYRRLSGQSHEHFIQVADLAEQFDQLIRVVLTEPARSAAALPKMLKFLARL